jgi:hypothetical protein
MNSKNHDILHDVILSYIEVVVKKGKVSHICHKCCLQTEAHEEKILSVEKDSIRFVVEVMSNCDWTIKLCIDNKHHRLLYAKF